MRPERRELAAVERVPVKKGRAAEPRPAKTKIMLLLSCSKMRARSRGYMGPAAKPTMKAAVSMRRPSWKKMRPVSAAVMATRFQVSREWRAMRLMRELDCRMRLASRPAQKQVGAPMVMPSDSPLRWA